MIASTRYLDGMRQYELEWNYMVDFDEAGDVRLWRELTINEHGTCCIKVKNCDQRQSTLRNVTVQELIQHATFRAPPLPSRNHTNRHGAAALAPINTEEQEDENDLKLEIQKLKEENGILKAQVLNTVVQLRGFTRRVNEQGDETLKTIEGRLNDLQRIHQTTIEGYETKLDFWKHEYATLQKRFEKCTARLSEAEGKMKTLEEQVTELEKRAKRKPIPIQRTESMTEEQWKVFSAKMRPPQHASEVRDPLPTISKP